jgi:O-antigen ligase
MVRSAREKVGRMTAPPTTSRIDRRFFALAADWLAVSVALALPWSTSVTGILIAVWLLAVLATLQPAALKRELLTGAGGLPVLLVCLGTAGMLWADVGWAARFGGLDGFVRLLMIPLLLMQFRRSERGIWVIYAFLFSSAGVLAASYFMVLTPRLDWSGHVYGIPVHDDIFQDSEFLICGFGALGCAFLGAGSRYRLLTFALVAAGMLFFANFAVAVFSRAALLVAPLLAALLGWRALRWKGLVTAGALIALVGLGAWYVSPNVQWRIGRTIEEFRDYRAANESTPVGEHLAFLKESLAIIAAAPLAGHGTGSIAEQFRQIAAGKTGVSAEATNNPHNQTFAVAIQLGLLGTLSLWAMWVAHLLLFRGEGLAAWLGTVVVVENIVSSTVHSHLFDFNSGWLYVFGVGVLGGMTLRQRADGPESF